MSVERFSEVYVETKQQKVLKSIVGAAVRSSDRAIIQNVGNLAFELITSPTLDLFRSLMLIEPTDNWLERDVFALRQIQALFKKRESISSLDNPARDSDTLAVFYKGEAVCRKYNRETFGTDPISRSARNVRAPLLLKMQRKIAEILGPCPHVDDLLPAIGPGATIGCSKNTSVRSKLHSQHTITREAAIYLDENLSPNAFPNWFSNISCKLVTGSRFASVPKTFLVDRGIEVNPLLNAAYQRGIGKYIGDRLRRFGIDLTDQSANQRLARVGSISGDLATIDLSMASDTIAYALVLDLLPPDWFNLLDAFRVARIEMPDGSWVIQEKFSAMGNGYTFELESLIFYSLLLSSCNPGETVSVYGDDLICPSHRFDIVTANLERLGFIPNLSKSFGTGPFRESCGKDYWHGTDVRPVFLKAELCDREIVRLHNFFQRTGRFDELPEKLISFLDKTSRTFGPDGFGDGHLVLSDIPMAFVRVRYQRRYIKFSTFVKRSRSHTRPYPTDWLARLYLTTYIGSLSESAIEQYGDANYNLFKVSSVIDETFYIERSMCKHGYLKRTVWVPVVD
jgi:hypothetical protein